MDEHTHVRTGLDRERESVCVCMYACVCVYVCVSMSVCAPVSVSVSICANLLHACSHGCRAPLKVFRSLRAAWFNGVGEWGGRACIIELRVVPDDRLDGLRVRAAELRSEYPSELDIREQSGNVRT
jgi:hypothetical protein